MKKNGLDFFVRLVTISLLISGFLLPAPSYGDGKAEKAYISSQDGTKIFIFDLANHKLAKTINIFTPTALGKALPPNINDIAVAGGKIFVTVPGPEITASGVNEVRVFDAGSDTPLGTIKAGLTPSGLLPYGEHVYVLNRYGNTIQAIDVKTLKIVRTIPFTNPKATALNNPIFMEIANNKIYLPFPGDLSRPGGIMVMDLTTGKYLKFIEFNTVSGYGPFAIKRIDDGKIYLGGAHNVAVLNTSTDEITKVLPLSSEDVLVQSFIVYKDKVYAANSVSTVDVIDGRKDTLLKEIDIGHHAYALHLRTDIAAGEDMIFVADAGRGLKIIDTKTEKLVSTIISDEPLGPIAVVPGR